MTRSALLRRSFAATAVLALSLTGALVVAGPAAAAVGDQLIVTSPLDGDTTSSRVVQFVGTGSDGDLVQVYDGSDSSLIGSATVAAGGAWTVSVTYPDDAAVDQDVLVTQNTTFGIVPLSITLPAASTPFVVTSPADGADLTTRFVDYEGTAPAGSTVTVTIDGETGFGSFFADADGNFAFQGYIPFDLGNDVTVVVTATQTDGTQLTPVTLDLSLLAPIAAPVIISPVTGSSITGKTVTFTGTGVAGTELVVIIFPADDATAGAFAEIDPNVLLQRVVVAPNGTFTASATLPLGNYTAAAVHSGPIVDGSAEPLSFPSNEVAFSLVAAVAPAATPPAVLAATGPMSTGFAGPAAALLLAGLLMVAASRRRRSLI